MENLEITKIFLSIKKEDYYKPVRVFILWGKNYIQYENSVDRNKTPSVEAYVKKIRLYLKDMINNLKKHGKIQLKIGNNC